MGYDNLILITGSPRRRAEDQLPQFFIAMMVNDYVGMLHQNERSARSHKIFDRSVVDLREDQKFYDDNAILHFHEALRGVSIAGLVVIT